MTSPQRFRTATVLSESKHNMYPFYHDTLDQCPMPVGATQYRSKEYVARITCLYKNNGAVSCVGGNVLFIWSLYLPIAALLHIINISPAPWCTVRCTQYFDTKLHGILPWAYIIGNCNTFFMNSWSVVRQRSQICKYGYVLQAKPGVGVST